MVGHNGFKVLFQPKNSVIPSFLQQRKNQSLLVKVQLAWNILTVMEFRSSLVSFMFTTLSDTCFDFIWNISVWLSFILKQNWADRILILIIPLLFSGLNAKSKICLPWLPDDPFICATFRKSKAVPCIRRCSCTKHICSKTKCHKKRVTSNLVPFDSFRCPTQVPAGDSINPNSVGSGTSRCGSGNRFLAGVPVTDCPTTSSRLLHRVTDYWIMH